MHCRGFVGYADADPLNVSELVKGAELRIAETRAVNRALRKAYGVGICSLEELGSPAEQTHSQNPTRRIPPQPVNGNFRGPKARDRLCQIIRQHSLDPALVKAYATEFCGAKALREATRERVEKFVSHLADRAAQGRDALLCQLNSYLPSQRRCGMRHYFESLRPADLSAIDSALNGLLLVRVDHARYRPQRKPYYQIRFIVLEPKHLAGCVITGRLYCTPRALWKLSWFLREFGYDSELLGKNEIDDQALVGLQGVVKISHAVVHGLSVLNLDGFAPAARWSELSLTSESGLPGSEVA